MADYAHEWTDKQLEELEKRVAAVYRQASEEMKQKLEKWYKDFERLDKQKAALVEAGKLEKAEYLAWRKGKMADSGRLKALVDTLTEDFVNSDKIAMGIVRGGMANVYALNANYAAYSIETDANVNLSWTLYDHSTVERMIREDPDVLPLPSVNVPLDERWNRKHLNNAITQGILQGESILHIADRLQNILGMDRTAAVRSARTATTAAESFGRLDAYKYAEEKGIHRKIIWKATLDGKTRHAHRELDGQMVDFGEPFHVDGYEIRCPGDPSAPGYLIYNCRCAIDTVDKFHDPKAPRIAVNPLTGKPEQIPGMTYKEWEAMHKAQNPEAWDLYQKKSQNLSSDKKQFAEYKAALGSSVPKSLDGFQRMKYTNTERWEFLKGYKRYITNVPESTETNYKNYVEISRSGIKGSVRVPAEKANIEQLSFRDEHAARHGCTIKEAREYVKNAEFSIRRKRWDGESVNYYSFSGATYVDPETCEIKAAFSSKDYDENISKIMEAIK